MDARVHDAEIEIGEGPEPLARGTVRFYDKGR
jgi:hypothetical protein